MSHQIDITENGTTTLATEGKYCDRNIDVNVNVASSGGSEAEDGLISGTLSGDYRNDRVTEVGQYGFYNQKNLTSLDLPNVTSISLSSIMGCNKLETANIPLLAYIPLYGFRNCAVLQSISFPLVTQIQSSGVAGCYLLSYVYIPSVAEIQSYAFEYCYSLKTVILGGTSVCKLSDANAFNSCYHILGTKDYTYNPEGLKDGYMFVPDNLLEDYRQATNWSAFADQIKPISELEE